MTRITKKLLAATFGMAVLYGNIGDVQACGGRGGGGGFGGGFGGHGGGYGGGISYRPAYRPQPSYPTYPSYSSMDAPPKPKFVRQPQPQVRPHPVSQFPSSGSQGDFGNPSSRQFPQQTAQSQPQQAQFQQQQGGQAQPRQQVAQRPVSQSRTTINNVSQSRTQPNQIAQQSAPQQSAPTAPQNSPEQNSAELNALQALAGWGGEDVQPEASPAQASQQQAPDHVGVWTARLGNGATVQLSLEGGGTFRWVATKDGKTSEFSGTYTLDNGSLTLLRATDSQQLAGSFAPQGNTAFNFKLSGATDSGLDFTRT